MFPQVREGQAQIFGVCPQSEISQFAAEKLSQTLARVNGYLHFFHGLDMALETGCEQKRLT